MGLAERKEQISEAVPEYEVETDDGLGLRGLAVVDDSGLGLGPHEAPTLCQEAVVTGTHLAFCEHCGRQMKANHVIRNDITQ